MIWLLWKLLTLPIRVVFGALSLTLKTVRFVGVSRILAFGAGGSAGGVILLAQVRLLVLVAVGVLLLGERDRLGRKALAAVLMLAGVAALVWTG